MPLITQFDCQQRDASDPLSALREAFSLPPGVIYLDGNSLGAMPKTTAARVHQVVTQEWGQGLIRSWNNAHWFSLPQRLGDKIAPLIGAAPGQVVVSDSTSINLYKVLSAALQIAKEDAPQRRQVLSERSNFPTDLYIAQSLCQQHGFELQLCEASEIDDLLNAKVAVLMLTHVNYRTGAMHDMTALTHAAHAVGALAVWDLAHSAGAVEVNLCTAQADFAVGCGYKYLNGGPGAPAFAWVNPQHVERFSQPLVGWWGHASPFAFTSDYHPAAGISRYLCGTQGILSLAALECGLDIFAQAEALGGMPALRLKSLALTDLMINLVQQRCSGLGLGLATPLAHAQRGSQVCLTRAEGAYAIISALIDRGVIGDYRAANDPTLPDILRFGMTPLYTRFDDIWNAVEHLRQILLSDEWRQAKYQQQQAVT
jgi:kynureninase